MAARTAGNRPQIAIRPAISPEMIPDAFSAATGEDIVAPVPPEPKIEESAARPPEAFVPAKSPGNKLSSTIQNDAAKPQKGSQSQDVFESKDVHHPAVHIDKKPLVSPSAPTDVQAEPAPQKPLVEKKGDKDVLIQDDAAKPQILQADTYKTLGLARFALDNSKEIPQRHDKEEHDNNNAVLSPGSVTEDKGSAQQQPIAEAERDEKEEEDAAVAPVIVIRPEENQMAKELKHTKKITALHNDKPNRTDLQQEISNSRPAMQAQNQKYDQDDNTVTINIGRIEVHAVFPQRQGLPAKEQAGVSLSQYLKLRSEGKI